MNNIDKEIYNPKRDYDLPMKLAVIGCKKTEYYLNMLLQYHGWYANNLLQDFKPENIYIVVDWLDSDMRKFRDIKGIPSQNILVGMVDDKIVNLYCKIRDKFLAEKRSGLQIQNRIIIFDYRPCDTINKIFINSNYINLSCILVTQKYRDVREAVKENASGLVIFGYCKRDCDLIYEDHVKQKHCLERFQDDLEMFVSEPDRALIVKCQPIIRLSPYRYFHQGGLS